MRDLARGFEYSPLISFVMVVRDDEEVWIKGTIDSVLAQSYPNVELRVVDNGSTRPHVAEVLKNREAADGRVASSRSPKTSRARALDTAVAATGGEFVAVLEAGDTLAPEMAFRLVEFLQDVPSDVIYADEDSLDVSGRRRDVTFKPYWSPDLFLSTAYVGRPCLLRKSVFESAGGFREGFDGAEEHDLLLRVTTETDRVHHLPEVLYHRRSFPNEPPTGKPPQTSERAAREAPTRRNAERDPEPPKVGVVVFVPDGFAPDGAEGVPVLADLAGTDHPISKVVGASARPRPWASVAESVVHPFPARAANLAAAAAGGEYVAFLNGLLRIEDPSWLSRLLDEARRPEVGAVGCAIRDFEGDLVQGGSLVPVALLTGHAGEPGFGDPLVGSDLPFNPAAVSVDCLVIRRSVFEGAGGFDDENLPTAFFDLDLCFRLRERGLLNVHVPGVSAAAHASLAPPSVRDLPGDEEVAYVWRRWWAQMVRLSRYRRVPGEQTYGLQEREVLRSIHASVEGC